MKASSLCQHSVAGSKVEREMKIFVRLITFWHLHSNTSSPKQCVQTALLWLLLLIFSLTQQARLEHMCWCKPCEEVEELTVTAWNQWGWLICSRCVRSSLQPAVIIPHAEAQRSWICLWNYIILQQWKKIDVLWSQLHRCWATTWFCFDFKKAAGRSSHSVKQNLWLSAEVVQALD